MIVVQPGPWAKMVTLPLGGWRSSGPSLLLLQAQEVLLMGPWTGNAQKTGKTRRKWVFFILRIQSALKLKKVVHTTVYGKLYKVLLNSDCLIKQCRAANQCLPRKNKVRIF